MTSKSGETGTKDVKRLSEQIAKLCGKIPVAKKETSQLTTLCEALSNSLSDRSLISQQPNYDDIKSNLVKVEEQLTGWSRFSLPKSLMKRAQIETGITELIGGLETTHINLSGFQRFPMLSNQPPILHLAAREHNLKTVGVLKGHLGEREQGKGSLVQGSVIMQKLQSHEPPRHTVEHEIQDTQSVETNEAPPVKRLDGEVTRQGDVAFAAGAYCDVWVGRWEKRSGERGSGEAGGEKVEVEKVALKALRIITSPELARTRLESELPRWAELRHLNILPFYGIVTDIGPHVYMVSPWQENGNLLVYVKNTPQPNKNYLLRGSAAGLSYLHSRGVVHGSVKCKNVLVSHEGEPQVCDFGIARISEEINKNATSKTVSSGDVVRYSAPELIETSDVPATTHSDTYSFAMLMLECITEEVPFSNLVRDAAVIHARISKKQFPPRPDGQDQKNRVSDVSWELMMRCWAIRPDQRPRMEQVHSFLVDNTID